MPKPQPNIYTVRKLTGEPAPGYAVEETPGTVALVRHETGSHWPVVPAQHFDPNSEYERGRALAKLQAKAIQVSLCIVVEPASEEPTP